MTDLIKQSDLKAVSFITTHKREDTIAVRLVLELLTKSLENNTPIFLDDIIRVHALYKLAASSFRRWEYIEYIDTKTNLSSKRNPKTIEESMKFTSRYSALPWFKINLGNAILKGRLLAIPVIDIK